MGVVSTYSTAILDLLDLLTVPFIGFNQGIHQGWKCLNIQMKWIFSQAHSSGCWLNPVHCTFIWRFWKREREVTGGCIWTGLASDIKDWFSTEWPKTTTQSQWPCAIWTSQGPGYLDCHHLNKGLSTHTGSVIYGEDYKFHSWPVPGKLKKGLWFWDQ